MAYRIAGIDVHKRMLAVVVSEVEVDGEYEFEQRQWGNTPGQLRWLASWLLEQELKEVVMELTAQYLEARLGRPGTVLEAALPEAGG
jgi:hypothetical protein